MRDRTFIEKGRAGVQCARHESRLRVRPAPEPSGGGGREARRGNGRGRRFENAQARGCHRGGVRRGIRENLSLPGKIYVFGRAVALHSGEKRCRGHGRFPGLFIRSGRRIGFGRSRSGPAYPVQSRGVQTAERLRLQQWRREGFFGIEGKSGNGPKSILAQQQAAGGRASPRRSGPHYRRAGNGEDGDARLPHSPSYRQVRRESREHTRPHLHEQGCSSNNTAA